MTNVWRLQDVDDGTFMVYEDEAAGVIETPYRIVRVGDGWIPVSDIPSDERDFRGFRPAATEDRAMVNLLALLERRR